MQKKSQFHSLGSGARRTISSDGNTTDLFVIQIIRRSTIPFAQILPAFHQCSLVAAQWRELQTRIHWPFFSLRICCILRVCSYHELAVRGSSTRCVWHRTSKFQRNIFSYNFSSLERSMYLEFFIPRTGNIGWLSNFVFHRDCTSLSPHSISHTSWEVLREPETRIRITQPRGLPDKSTFYPDLKTHSRIMYLLFTP